MLYLLRLPAETLARSKIARWGSSTVHRQMAPFTEWGRQAGTVSAVVVVSIWLTHRSGMGVRNRVTLRECADRVSLGLRSNVRLIPRRALIRWMLSLVMKK